MGRSEAHFAGQTLATVTKCRILSKNNRNNRYIVRLKSSDFDDN